MTVTTTETQVRLQLAAMRSTSFELLLLTFGDDTKAAMHTLDAEALLRRLPWLKAQNAKGQNVNIRPTTNHLTLLDDLTLTQTQKLTSSGYQPCVIVETSPTNFQAWVDHGRQLEREEATAAARILAERFSSDKGAAGRRHAGRLAGFTNRKPSRQRTNGLYPFVRLHHAEQTTFSRAQEFAQELATLPPTVEPTPTPRAVFYPLARALKTIQQYHDDPRYDGDLSRADFAYAIYAHSHGVPDSEIEAAILSRNMRKKGTVSTQRRYALYTLRRAKRFTA